MKKSIIYFLFLFISFSSCTQNIEKNEKQLNLNPISINEKNVHKAYFASGCFWCVEAIYESLVGVKTVTSGYSGGSTKNPTYELVNTKLTGHAETIEVVYNPKKNHFFKFIRCVFWFSKFQPTKRPRTR